MQELEGGSLEGLSPYSGIWGWEALLTDIFFFISFALIFLSEAENKQGKLFCALCVDRRNPTTVASQRDWLAAQEFLGGLLYLAVAEALDHGFSWASAAVRSYQVCIFLL